MTMNTRSIFVLAILISITSSTKATEGHFIYTSDFKTRLVVNIHDKEIAIVDAVLEFETCGKSCISAGGLALDAVEGREKRGVGGLEFWPREGAMQRLLGAPCRMIDVYKDDGYVGEYCHSVDKGILAFRMNRFESGKWFYLQQSQGVFFDPR